MGAIEEGEIKECLPKRATFEQRPEEVREGTRQAWKDLSRPRNGKCKGLDAGAS